MGPVVNIKLKTFQSPVERFVILYNNVPIFLNKMTVNQNGTHLCRKVRPGIMPGQPTVSVGGAVIPHAENM